MRSFVEYHLILCQIAGARVKQQIIIWLLLIVEAVILAIIPAQLVILRPGIAVYLATLGIISQAALALHAIQHAKHAMEVVQINVYRAHLKDT